ncbi:GNAT family N-acetyltransferase [Vibrio sp. Of7-15]|uniref:GNAT family N-acetyltransferase n=1 Tax=Vibrio sp. Of7-15 TaxID=2724879 RepID=UPI001EF1AA31|nr:GNAT family N-acetyltransferase [Vibrio sp. Of7-15]MCG7497976.1 GNAT family N-acetyltransferase [Vibrio sp. Of7-15]
MLYSNLKQGQPYPLTTDDLTIRLIREDDLPDVFSTLENPNVTQYLFFAPAPLEVYQAFFTPIVEETQNAIEKEKWPEHPTFIIRDNSQRYMGMVGLTQVMLLQGNFEIGFQLPEHAWQQGIATAACQLLTHIAFSELDAHKIAADCYAQNIGSAAVLKKSGFTQEGSQTGYYKINATYDDRLIFGITSAQYSAL